MGFTWPDMSMRAHAHICLYILSFQKTLVSSSTLFLLSLIIDGDKIPLHPPPPRGRTCSAGIGLRPHDLIIVLTLFCCIPTYVAIIFAYSAIF